MTEKQNDSRITWTDPDEAPELTDEWFEGADLKEGSRLIRRGRPISGQKKVLLSVRYSQEVVDYFRSTGEGWQTRMDAVLKEWIEQHR
ncbi:BrnA antitoxin family protein [Leptospirillum ferriphilum]|uniref:BrnA antitoxin family protein n=1 Tax=Leptospirillum ferriphilum TaxID=178606 RepID=UPI0006B1DA17|nr:BrnA antitoxin family protein [Leptospirillum ferriphilum]MDA8060117.1 BrnA antitoxin family protein [Nitrospiraceae bacterium]MDA8150989.1 BrnA antitoxin family protein [Nitrospiraceae bacterium]